MEIILKYTGIGGLGIAIFFFIIKDFIKNKLFSKLGREHSYKILKMIIWFCFILSILCLVSYFIIHNPTLTKSKISNTTIKGNDIIILNGNGNISKGGELEFVNQPDSLFWDFLQENEGRRIYISFILNTYPYVHISPDQNGFYNVGAKNINYTFTDGKPKGTYIEGNLKSASMDLLWPTDGGKILSTSEDSNRTFDAYNYEMLKIEASKNNEGALYYNRGEIYLKGYFIPYYIVNHGYNEMTLKSQ